MVGGERMDGCGGTSGSPAVRVTGGQGQGAGRKDRTHSGRVTSCCFLGAGKPEPERATQPGSSAVSAWRRIGGCSLPAGALPSPLLEPESLWARQWALSASHCHWPKQSSSEREWGPAAIRRAARPVATSKRASLSTHCMIRAQTSLGSLAVWGS